MTEPEASVTRPLTLAYWANITHAEKNQTGCSEHRRSENKTDRTRVRARRDEVRAAECRVEVVQGDLVGDVGYREAKCHARVLFLREQVIDTGAKIDNMPRCNARRVVIIICGAGGRYFHTCCPKV